MEPVAVFKKRGAKSKANLRKRPVTPPPADSDSDFSSDDETGQRIKRRKRNNAATAPTAAVAASSRDAASAGPTKDISRQTVFSADRNRALDSHNDATKQSNWYDEEEGKDDDDLLSAKNLLGSAARKKKNPAGGSAKTIGGDYNGADDAAAAPPPPDGIYRGLANQTSYIQKNPNAPSRTVGPIKAPTNIRTITITDMAPDTCKDYRLTGWCGFGDNCKFAHVREDYAHGWQLDKEWENVTKGKKVITGTVVASADRRSKTNNKDGDDNNNNEDDNEEGMLDNIPFACIICKGPYKSPVVTRCGHYFCEACALKRYRRDPGCAACGSGTNGVFNSAKKLQKLLDRKRERAAKRRQEAIENGEEVSEDEEGGSGGEEGED